MGDQKRFCVFPKSQRVCSVQGDPIIAINQPDSQLCKGIGEDCVRRDVARLFVSC